MRVFDEQNGVAGSGQILARMTRHAFESAVHSGVLERIWHGIYCRGEPTERLRLHGLDLSCGKKVPLCLTSAAAVHGFDTEGSADLHVLNPPGCQLRSVDGLVVHRGDGAPLTVVAVRNLIALADERAESPMESEARLVMLDGGLPAPELQYEVIDGNGQGRRLDFAWPGQRIAVEYDSLDWHGSPDALRDDRRRTAALMDIGWIVIAIAIVFEDVRHRGGEMVARINAQLSHARAA